MPAIAPSLRPEEFFTLDFGFIMRAHSNLISILLLLVLSTACATGSSAGAPAERVDRDILTEQQLREHGFRNAYDAVATLRRHWLMTRGTDSFANPTEVLVYYDNTRLGGVETLRSLAIPTITYIRYYDGLAATARWGIGHGQGVIFISTFPL